MRWRRQPSEKILSFHRTRRFSPQASITFFSSFAPWARAHPANTLLIMIETRKFMCDVFSIAWCTAHSSEVVLYLAPDQNLPQSNFLFSLKIAVNENYDIHYSVYTECLLQMWRPIILFRRCLMPWYSLFSSFLCTQGRKHNNLVPLHVVVF